MTDTAANDRVYIHEFIDIRGHHRADYMQHMAANWSPAAQRSRDQLCYGVWAVLGSTGAWPQVVNMWEEPGWAGLARSFGGEAVGKGAQDPALARWWAKAAEFRRGGFDRIVEPMPWSRPISRLITDGVRGECYAHELITVEPGRSADLCELAHTNATAVYREFGWELAGAFTTAMRNDDEALLLWAVPTWAQWAEAEAAQRSEAVQVWRRSARKLVTTWSRVLLVDAPLSPMRIGRQPATSDQVEAGWAD